MTNPHSTVITGGKTVQFRKLQKALGSSACSSQDTLRSLIVPRSPGGTPPFLSALPCTLSLSSLLSSFPPWLCPLFPAVSAPPTFPPLNPRLFSSSSNFLLSIFQGRCDILRSHWGSYSQPKTSATLMIDRVHLWIFFKHNSHAGLTNSPPTNPQLAKLSFHTQLRGATSPDTKQNCPSLLWTVNGAIEVERH